MPTAIGQKRRQILDALQANQEGSQGQPGLREKSPVEKLMIGGIRGVTAPLDLVGLAVEPSYGPGGPGVAGTIGELGGSIAPFLLAETALERFVPMLKGRGLIPTATRAATSLGVLEFGRAPQGDETRTGNAMRGAIQGAIIGTTSGGSLMKAALGGAAATAVPLALGSDIRSPVAITGNETADAVIFNAALAGAFQAVHQHLSADRPSVVSDESGTSTAPPVPPAPPSGPITDPSRLLRPRTFYQPPAPTEMPLDRRVPARAPIRNVVDEIKANIESDPLYRPSADVMKVPEVASYFERVNQLRSQVGMGAATAQEIDQAIQPDTSVVQAVTALPEPVQQMQESAVRLRREFMKTGNTAYKDAADHLDVMIKQYVPPAPAKVDSVTSIESYKADRVIEALEQFAKTEGMGSIELPKSALPVIRDQFFAPRVRGETTAPIEPSKPVSSPLIQLVRSADEQAKLEAKAAELKSSAGVTAGRIIALSDATAESIPADTPGFDSVNKTINTSGLGLEDVDHLIGLAKDIGDPTLAKTLGRTRAGLAGTGKQKGKISFRPERKTATVASEVVEKAKAVAPSAEEVTQARLSSSDSPMLAWEDRVEASVDIAERRIIEIESGDILPGQMTQKSKKFVGDLDRVKQGRSGDVYSYANMLKAMKDMRTPIVGVEGDKFKVAMPDETIATLSKDEIIARIEKSLPPTNAVPVFQGPDAPPLEQAIQPQPKPPSAEVRPIPEPSEVVVLKSAEREYPVGPGTGEGPGAAPRDFKSEDEVGGPLPTFTNEEEGMQKIIEITRKRLTLEDRALLAKSKTNTKASAEVTKVVQSGDPARSLLFQIAQKGNQIESLNEIWKATKSVETKNRVTVVMDKLANETADLMDQYHNLTQKGPGTGEGPGAMKAKGAKIGRIVELTPTTRNINKFLKERGITGTYERLPNRHKTAFAKGEAESKGLQIDISPQGVAVQDHVTGKTTKFATLDEAVKFVAANPNNEGPMRTVDELQSLFRRRFAAAKNSFERNNIRRKYPLYSAYMDTSPLRPGETPLDSLDGIINRRVPPTVNLDPPSAGGAGRINLPPDKPPTIPGGGPTIGDSITPEDLSGMGWRRNFEPMKYWALALEKKTNGLIPAYTKIFAPLDEGRQALQVFLSGYYPDLIKAWRPFKGDLAARERIGQYLEAPDKVAAVKALGISPPEVKSAEKLRELWNKAYTDFGYDAREGINFIENYLPWRRLNRELSEGDALAQFYRNQVKPRSYGVWHELERTTNGEWARDLDAFKLFHNYLATGAKAKFLSQVHASAAEIANNVALPRGTESTRGVLIKYIDRMYGMADPSSKALNDFTDGLLQKLGVNTDKQFRTDVVSMLLQLNVGAHMAWRAPLAIRNMFQIFFVYPMVGEKAFSYGFRQALTAEGKAAAIKAKVIGPDAVPFGDEIFNPFGMLSQVVRSGLKAYSKVDDFTRSVAYHATQFKVLEAAQEYRAKGWNIAQFSEKAELESMFHPVEAKQISDMVKSGNSVGAAERAGYLMQENTNFIYRAGNAPEAFRGVAGRLFGQFGMWPVSYVEYLRYISTFGTANQRASKIARFMAINTAFGSAGTMLGVNTWKWLMFGPLVFTGGPMLQIAQDATKVVSAASQGRIDDDPEASMALSRLKKNVPSSFIPGSGFLKDVEATLDEAPYGAQSAVTRMLTGQTPEATFSALPPLGQPPPSGMTPRARRKAIVERLQSAPPKPASR